METKLKINNPIIVEGRYDKIKLDSIVDGLVIAVNGFSLFTDYPLRDMLVNMSKKSSLILLLDSDAAGFKIRGFLHSILAKEAYTDIYIPDIHGVEKRKPKASKEGKLGVEGINAQLLKSLLSGLHNDAVAHSSGITSIDFMRMGLSGSKNSANLRAKLYESLSLPEHISSKNAINILNRTVSKQQLEELVTKIKGEFL